MKKLMAILLSLTLACAAVLPALAEGKKVVVLPTKTVPQGISAMLAFDPDASEADNVSGMTEEEAAAEAGRTVVFGISPQGNNDNNYKKAFYLSSPDKPFITILTNSIFKSFKTLVNMLGIIMIFLMITTIIKKIIPVRGITNGLLSGFLEMTQGVKYISSLDISLPIKASILSAIVSFSGLSVHFQVKSIIDGTDIKYSNFLKARVVQSFISFFLTLAIFKIL